MLYDFLEENIRTQFVSVRDLKTGLRGQVTLIRHRSAGTQMVLRSFQGSAAVYQKLLTVNCSNLPRVAEAAEKDGHVLVLEEYIQGDPLSPAGGWEDPSAKTGCGHSPAGLRRSVGAP